MYIRMINISFIFENRLLQKNSASSSRIFANFHIFLQLLISSRSLSPQQQVIYFRFLLHSQLFLLFYNRDNLTYFTLYAKLSSYLLRILEFMYLCVCLCKCVYLICISYRHEGEYHFIHINTFWKILVRYNWLLGGFGFQKKFMTLVCFNATTTGWIYVCKYRYAGLKLPRKVFNLIS